MRKIYYILIFAFVLFITFSINFSEISCGKKENLIGRIYGTTYEIIGWNINPVSFSIVRTNFKFNISNLFGEYELNGLALNQVYEVTAKKFGYQETTIYVELTNAEPEIELNIEMIHRDSSLKVSSHIMH